MQWLTTLAKVPRYSVYFARAFVAFDSPLRVIWHYLRRSTPPEGYIQIRNGPRIRLSGHPHDAITVFVVFAKRDYGIVKRDSVVVDVGANIGVFTLYAVHCGAKRVVSYEPSAEAHAVLTQNVAENQLGDRVTVHRKAVSDADGRLVSIPKAASPYNEVGGPQGSGDTDLVDTVSLSTILRDLATNQVDLLKCDCEGAEYAFLMRAAVADGSRLNEIRMEYHAGPLQELVQTFGTFGLQVTHKDEDGAMLWLARQ